MESLSGKAIQLAVLAEKPVLEQTRDEPNTSWVGSEQIDLPSVDESG